MSIIEGLPSFGAVKGAGVLYPLFGLTKSTARDAFKDWVAENEFEHIKNDIFLPTLAEITELVGQLGFVVTDDSFGRQFEDVTDHVFIPNVISRLCNGLATTVGGPSLSPVSVAISTAKTLELLESHFYPSYTAFEKGVPFDDIAWFPEFPEAEIVSLSDSDEYREAWKRARGRRSGLTPEEIERKETNAWHKKLIDVQSSITMEHISDLVGVTNTDDVKQMKNIGEEILVQWLSCFCWCDLVALFVSEYISTMVESEYDFEELIARFEATCIQRKVMFSHEGHLSMEKTFDYSDFLDEAIRNGTLSEEYVAYLKGDASFPSSQQTNSENDDESTNSAKSNKTSNT